jgi:hypothetical protein
MRYRPRDSNPTKVKGRKRKKRRRRKRWGATASQSVVSEDSGVDEDLPRNGRLRRFIPGGSRIDTFLYHPMYVAHERMMRPSMQRFQATSIPI